MKIHGFQKLTLLDFPEKTAATVFTGGCNFRCPFCHNGDLVLAPASVEEIPMEEIFATLSKRRGFLDGVCITGGEPLLNADISTFMKKIKDMGLLVKLDTNGTFPERLQELLSSGLLDYVAVDIKNSKESYAKTIGLEKFDVSCIEKSVELLRSSDVTHEFRTTLVRELHTVEDMRKIGEWLRGTERYFLQAFKLSDNVLDKTLTGFEKNELEEMLLAVKEYIPNAKLRGI